MQAEAVKKQGLSLLGKDWKRVKSQPQIGQKERGKKTERTTIKERVVAEPTTQEEYIAVAIGEVQTHLLQGKAHFKAGRYTEALEEFETFLKIAPGNIETRVWIRKVKEELTKQQIETIAEE